MLRKLVFSFDCDEGQDGNVFEHALALVMTMLGEPAGKVFSHYVDATDGRYYLKENFALACWRDICEAAKESP